MSNKPCKICDQMHNLQLWDVECSSKCDGIAFILKEGVDINEVHLNTLINEKLNHIMNTIIANSKLKQVIIYLPRYLPMDNSTIGILLSSYKRLHDNEIHLTITTSGDVYNELVSLSLDKILTLERGLHPLHT